MIVTTGCLDCFFQRTVIADTDAKDICSHLLTDDIHGVILYIVNIYNIDTREVVYEYHHQQFQWETDL